MRILKPHPNVVSLLGCCIEKGRLFYKLTIFSINMKVHLCWFISVKEQPSKGLLPPFSVTRPKGREEDQLVDRKLQV